MLVGTRTPEVACESAETLQRERGQRSAALEALQVRYDSAAAESVSLRSQMGAMRAEGSDLTRGV